MIDCPDDDYPCPPCPPQHSLGEVFMAAVVAAAVPALVNAAGNLCREIWRTHVHAAAMAALDQLPAEEAEKGDES